MSQPVRPVDQIPTDHQDVPIAAVPMTAPPARPAPSAQVPSDGTG
jgi:hypothetical protein